MAVPVQKFREVVFQILYSYDMSKADNENMVELLSNELSISKKTVRDALERVKQILLHQDEIDDTIARTSLSYAFERIQSVERNILRLGTFEILFDKNIPQKVAIAEAMRLARKFSTKESASFINAILDTISKANSGEQTSPNLLKESTDQLLKSEQAAQQAAQEKKDKKVSNK